ncbi:MAG: hypothetical protein ACKOW6_00085, partial [Fluviibacter sp.]
MLLHEFLVPGIQLCAWVACQRCQLEIEKGMDVQRAGLIRRLDELSLEQKRRITLPLLREALAES